MASPCLGKSSVVMQDRSKKVPRPAAKPLTKSWRHGDWRQALQKGELPRQVSMVADELTYRQAGPTKMVENRDETTRVASGTLASET
eukprot:symbB.v1.2.016913.t1/scaffold1304.1/size242089/7